jgi:hypothetical protein
MLKKLREMMNVKIRLLRGLLEEAIKNIDAGNSNHTEEELNAIIDDLTKLNRGIKRISKTYACEKILHCSPSRTCRMISGEVVLPNTPVVTGYGSYNPCTCTSTATAPTA